MDSTGATSSDHYDKALAAHQAGNLDDAIAGYRQVVALEAGHRVAFNNLGTALKAQGKLDEAIAAYERAVTLDPAYAAAIYNLGTAYHVAGDYSSALIQYQRVAEIRPEDPNNLYNMGLIAEFLYLYGLAIEAFRAVLQIDPAKPSAQAGLARCLSASGETAAAMQLFEGLVQSNPGHPIFWMNYGEALARAGSFPKAIECMQRAAALAPQAIEVRMELALTLYRMGEFAAAASVCHDVHRQDAMFGPALLLMAAALRKLGQIAEAEAIELAAQALPSPAPLWVTSLVEIPTLPFDRAQIQRIRDNFFALAQQAEEFGGKLADPSVTVASTPFYYAYHGRNDREIMARLADVLVRMTPDLLWEAPHTRLPR